MAQPQPVHSHTTFEGHMFYGNIDQTDQDSTCRSDPLEKYYLYMYLKDKGLHYLVRQLFQRGFQFPLHHRGIHLNKYCTDRAMGWSRSQGQREHDFVLGLPAPNTVRKLSGWHKDLHTENAHAQEKSIPRAHKSPRAHHKGRSHQTPQGRMIHQQCLFLIQDKSYLGRAYLCYS